jgi:dihydrofolate reductase
MEICGRRQAPWFVRRVSLPRLVITNKSKDIADSTIRAGQLCNEARKYVASRTLYSLDCSNSVLIEEEAAEGVAALKNEERPELQVHGSGNLIQTLLRHELVDEFRLWTFPLVVGCGKRLFSDGTIPARLKLVGRSAFYNRSSDRYICAGWPASLIPRSVVPVCREKNA